MYCTTCMCVCGGGGGTQAKYKELQITCCMQIAEPVITSTTSAAKARDRWWKGTEPTGWRQHWDAFHRSQNNNILNTSDLHAPPQPILQPCTSTPTILNSDLSQNLMGLLIITSWNRKQKPGAPLLRSDSHARTCEGLSYSAKRESQHHHVSHYITAVNVQASPIQPCLYFNIK